MKLDKAMKLQLSLKGARNGLIDNLLTFKATKDFGREDWIELALVALDQADIDPKEANKIRARIGTLLGLDI